MWAGGLKQEFAPGAGADDVAEIGERVRRAVGETTVPDGEQRIAVTVSVGGATYQGAVDSPEMLIAKVDAALYDAKETGRNRLVMA